MKYLLGAFFILVSFNAKADLRADLQECEYTCDRRCERLVDRLDNRLDRVRTSCGFDQPRDPPRRNGEKVEFYRSSYCSSSYLGSVRNSRDCEEFANATTEAVFGIKIGDKCLNINDTTAISACKAFTGASSNDVQLYRSSYCSNNLVAFVNPRTNCRELSKHIKSEVWGIKVNGVCQNVSDTSFASACQKYKNE